MLPLHTDRFRVNQEERKHAMSSLEFFVFKDKRSKLKTQTLQEITELLTCERALAAKIYTSLTSFVPVIDTRPWVTFLRELSWCREALLNTTDSSLDPLKITEDWLLAPASSNVMNTLALYEFARCFGAQRRQKIFQTFEISGYSHALKDYEFAVQLSLPECKNLTISYEKTLSMVNLKSLNKLEKFSINTDFKGVKSALQSLPAIDVFKAQVQMT